MLNKDMQEKIATPRAAEASSAEPQKPLSNRKLVANRENARLSTGPKTPEGKAKSSRNAITHGIFARQYLIGASLETVEEMSTLTAEINDHYQPVGVMEELLAQKIAIEIGRRGRVMQLEQKELARQNTLFNSSIDRLIRYSSSTDRALFHAIDQLEGLQAQRKSQKNAGANTGAGETPPAKGLEEVASAK